MRLKRPSRFEGLVTPRAVARVVPAVRTFEGEGFLVHRSFPTQTLPLLDPFLLLDEMGPMDVAPGAAKGAPDHPHRGFETVTYMLAGEMMHEDSAGHAGTLGPGDVQWMTAGAGVVHSEMPSPAFRERGGRFHGFQLWVNLPRAEKMARPRYQERRAAAIPVARSSDGRARVRVLAGEALGVRAAIETRLPISYFHVELAAGAAVDLALPREHNAAVYVIEGAPAVAGRALKRGDFAILGADGDGVALAGGPAAASLLVLSGRPLGEPVARYGPFVMNTEAEIVAAIRDYQTGNFGAIAR